MLTDEIEERLRAEVKAEVNEASQRAEAATRAGRRPPLPLHVYAEDGGLMAELNILEAIRSAMDEEMERDERVMVLGEDVGKKGGVFGATEGLWAKYGDKRVLDTPLTEGMIAGAAMGAAVYGLRPIAEMQFADFVYPGLQPDRLRDQPDPLPLERRRSARRWSSACRTAVASTARCTTASRTRATSPRRSA